MAEKAEKSKSNKTAILNRSANPFPVVGIGASAGGLEAFKKLLKAIPEKSGIAYVFVQHLDPTHESKLKALLQKVTPIPVIEIINEITIQPDHIYIIPGNKMLTVNDDKLILKTQPAKSNIQRNQTIDIFFTSLAQTHEAQAIGIILSGTASDGTKGLKAIKDHGGLTIAQSKASAAYQGMPQSAIDAGVADFILAPEKIPQKLLDIAKAIAIAGKEAKTASEEDVFKEILSILRSRKGMDFTYYKQTTIRRRIIRRTVLNKFKTIGTYAKYLQENTAEQDALYQDMLIPVTSFFRDTRAFENLCESVFPSLIKNKTTDGIIRIWVAGCSTGEEAYSIAICFKEYLGHKKEKIQIFATDLSEAAIIKARAGIYSKADAEPVSPGRLKEYFTYTQGVYQVSKELRDMCIFAVHNFLKDPPFGRIDFISCRNVLIYMDTYLQKKALDTFHYALNPKGLLMLGKSENTIGITDLFASHGKSEKIFTRKDVPTRIVPVMTIQTEKVLPEIKSNYTTEIVRTDFQKIADDIMLREYIPAAVVVNESLDIVHSRGTTSLYLELFPGKPSLNLLKMAKMGLAFELRGIVHKVKKDKKIHKKDNIPVRINKTEYDISIEVRPLPHTIEPYYLVLFDRKPSTNKITSAKAAGKTKKDDYALRIQQLEQELTLLREDMRTITEDQEASNEELQSTNEELLSSNEELQSLNEELETSKEELQSTVEELTVVNQEMVNLNEQLAFEKESAETARKQLEESENKFRQLADSLPLLVWQTDAQGNQTFASARWKEFTGLDPENADSFEKMVHPDDIEGIVKAWTNSLTTGATYRHEVRLKSKEGKYHWFQVHGEPLYNDKKEVEKWIGAFTDITDRKEAEQGIKASEEKFSTLADNMENLAWIADGEGWIYWYNKRWLEYTGLTLEEMQGWGWQKVHHPDHVDRILEISKKIWHVNETFELTFPLRRYDGEYRWFLTRGRPIADANGKVIRWLGTNTDITEQMKIAEDLKKTKEQLELTFRNVPAAIYHFDKNGKILYLNEKGATQMGYASAEQVLAEKDIFQFRKKLDETYLVLDQSGKPLPVEQSSAAITFRTNQASEIVAEMVNKKTGNSFWLLSKSAPLFNEAGELIMVLTTSTDITFQKTAEKTLLYRKALLEAHNEASFDGILLVDAKGKILSYNHKFIEIWNMPQDIAESKDDEAALSFAMTQLVHPEQFIEKVKWLYQHPTETVKDILEYKDGKIVERHGYPVVAEDGSYYAWSWTFRDITEQTQAEIKIKESEKQLRKTTEHFQIATTAAEVGTWSLDIPSETLVWSGLHKKMWGYDEQRTDLMFEDWHKVILPGDKEDAFAEVAKALKTKTLYEASYRIKRSDNSEVRWIRSLGQYFYTDAGEPVTLTGVSIDITEQKKAEIALKESENLYHNLIYSSPSAIGVLKGEDMVITTANDAIIEIWGKGKEIMGKKYFEALPELAEQGYKEVFAEVYKTGIPFNAVETPVLILQKGKMTLKYYNFLLYAQRNIYDTIDGIGIIATEVTSQALLNKQVQESEKRFRLLADSMPQHIWTADVKGNFNYFNQSVYDYSGLTLQQINKDGWLQIVHPDDREENIRQWIESVTKGADFLFEHRFRRYDGEYRWQLSRAVPQKDADGNITMWVGTSTDIQKIKEDEQRKDDFLKMVSHELKTPVTSIKGYVQFLLSLLKDQPEKETSAFPLKSSLVRVDIQILRLTRLITEMLDLSRIESGQLELQKESFSLNGLVTETIQDILHTIKSHKINLQEDFKFTVTGDRDRIGQVLINFINNALKYSPGGDTVDVRIYKASENQVAVSVKDYGIGIGKEDQEKIFERFYRVSGEAQQNFSGFGIGLFIANEVIQRHHGNITVESEKGKGSVFTFILPLSAII